MARSRPVGPTVDDHRYFFLHVMKTAGGTFSHYLRTGRRHGDVYPEVGLDPDLEVATIDIEYLLGLPAERRRSIRVFTGHFPSVVPDLLGEPVRRITILRDPVERTLSYLRHCRMYNPQHRDVPFEAIYEDPFQFSGFIRDHQTKQFAMTADDHPKTFFDDVVIDDERLALARTNLERVDVVGLTEAFPALVAEVRRRWGWGPLEGEDFHRAEHVEEVPASFRRRIAEDNAYDLALYEHARQLVAERARRGALH